MSNNSSYNVRKAFIRYMRLERNLSANTIEAYVRDTDRLIAFLSQQGLSLTQATIKHLQAFSASLYDIGIGTTTHCRILSGIRTLYKFLVLDGYIDKDPAELLESPRPGDRLPQVLTTEEVDRLEAAIDLSKWEGQRNKAIIEVLFSCGLRVSELVTLHLSDLYLEEGFIRVLGKGNKERIVYLNNSCLNAINNYLAVLNSGEKIKRSDKEKDALFLNKNGKRIGARRVEQIVEDCLKQAGLDGMGISPHKLRHTAATLLYQDAGVDIRVLKELLGHESLSTTEIYTHVSNKQIEDASKKSPLGNIKPKKSVKNSDNG